MSPVSVRIAGLWSAFALSVTVLPFVWVRSVGDTVTFGAPGPRTAVLLVFSVGGICSLGWYLRRRYGCTTGSGRTFGSLLVIGWCVAVCISVYIEWLIWGPSIIALTLIALASLHILWLAWMSWLPASWSMRVGILLMLVVCVAPFMLLYSFAGYAGAGRTAIRWRGLSMAIHEDLGSVAVPVLRHEDVGDYPQFMGPNRSGVLDELQLPDWDASPPREVWRRELGAGWSSFAVVGGTAYTQCEHENQECVIALAVNDGHLLWRHEDALSFHSAAGGDGPRATPTVDQGRVFAVGATGRLNCLEAQTGQLIWQTDIHDTEPLLPHGTAASPLVVGDLVIVCPVAEQGSSVAAYDRIGGQLRWQQPEYRSSYSSPIVTKIDGQDQVLLYQQDGLRAFDLQTGVALWDFPWSNDTQTNASQPIVQAGDPSRVFLSTGYGKGAVLLEVTRVNDAWTVRERWTSRGLKTKFCSAVMAGNTIFGLDDGILAAIDAETGEQRWKKGRFGHGQMLRAGDKLIIVAERGDVSLVAADAVGFRELGRIDALSSKTWNHPALAWPYLLLRNDREAVCFRLDVGE